MVGYRYRYPAYFADEGFTLEDFDDISYDDDELMLLDLEGPSTLAKKLPSKSTTNNIASPPRAPKNPAVQMQSVSSMMMSQAVYIPPMPRVPASDTNNNNKENDATSREKSKAQSSSGRITAVKPSAPIPASLSAKVMQPPFTSKLNGVAKLGSSSSKSTTGKGQSSLSSFIVKGDNASDADSSFASTSSTSASGVGKKRSQPVPWELEESTKPQKSARTDSKGKGKGGPGIGSLNVKQQIVLSAEQQKVLKMVVDEKKNVFFTGSAGPSLLLPSLSYTFLETDPETYSLVLPSSYRNGKIHPTTRNHRFSPPKVCQQRFRSGSSDCFYWNGGGEHWRNDNPLFCRYRSWSRHGRATCRFCQKESESRWSMDA